MDGTLGYVYGSSNKVASLSLLIWAHRPAVHPLPHFLGSLHRRHTSQSHRICCLTHMLFVHVLPHASFATSRMEA